MIASAAWRPTLPRTAPAPNIPAIPGMNPGTLIMAGGTTSASASKSGKGGCGAGGPASGCGHASHGGIDAGTVSKGDPVDPVTGRVFTDEVVDLRLHGPFPLELARAYSSEARGRDVGFGAGWSHSFAWSLTAYRHRVIVYKNDGTAVRFDAPAEGEGALGPGGLVLVRTTWGYVLDDEGVSLLFGPGENNDFVLTAKVDAWGNRVRLRYDRGRLVAIEDAVGRTLGLAHDASGHVIRVTATDGENTQVAVELSYDGHHMVLSYDAEGAARRYGYGKDGLLLAYTRPSGLTFHYRYDEQARCVETWGDYAERPDPSLDSALSPTLADDTTAAKGIYHCVFVYGDDGFTEVVDPVRVDRFVGNTLGSVDIAVNGGAVHSRTFDSHGHVTSFTDPDGATTTFERDERGQLVRTTAPDGTETSIERTASGGIRRIVDARGGATEVLPAEGRLVWRDPIGALFQVEMDQRGLITATVAPNGGRTEHRHDAQGNEVETVGRAGKVLRRTFDWLGRCTSVTGPAGGTVAYSRDKLGNLLAVTDEAGATTRYEYDGDGMVVSATDPGGRTTHYRRGGLNKICTIERPDGSVVGLRYDRAGRLVRVTNPRGDEHQIELDGRGLVARERCFDGRTLSYGYDLTGRKLWCEDAAGRTELERDTCGRLTKRTYPDGHEETFGYNAKGELVVAGNNDTTILIERNAVGWITRETLVVGGDQHVVDSRHDAMGRVVERRTSHGHELTVERDLYGRAVARTADGQRLTTTYDAAGRQLATELPGGGRIETRYDVAGRVVQRCALATSKGEPAERGRPEWVGPVPPNAVSLTSYQYSSAAEMTAVFDIEHGATELRYDPMRQLIAVIPEHAHADFFRYDEAGNAAEEDARDSWDAESRLVEAGDQHLHWNANGTLAHIDEGGRRVAFIYDAFGRRVEKRVSEQPVSGAWRAKEITRFVWDGDSLVHDIAYRAADGADPIVVQRTFCFEDDGRTPCAHGYQEGGSDARWRFYLNDPNGAPQRLLRGDGRVAAIVRRDAWGAPDRAVPADRADDTPLGFVGQYHDRETRLAYNRHRYYAPALRRYVSPDPIGLEGGLNPFAYAQNNPVAFIDPYGLSPLAVIRDAKGREVVRSQSGTRGGSTEHSAAVAQCVDNGSRFIGHDGAVHDDAHPIRTEDNKAITTSSNTCAEAGALTELEKVIRKRKGLEGKHDDKSNRKVKSEMQKFFKDGGTMTTYAGSSTEGSTMDPCPACARTIEDFFEPVPAEKPKWAGEHPAAVRKYKNETSAETRYPGMKGHTRARNEGKEIKKDALNQWDGQTTQSGTAATTRAPRVDNRDFSTIEIGAHHEREVDIHRSEETAEAIRNQRYTNQDERDRLAVADAMADQQGGDRATVTDSRKDRHTSAALVIGNEPPPLEFDDDDQERVAPYEPENDP